MVTLHAMASPCPAARLIHDDGPAAICTIESTPAGIAGEPGAPVSIVKQRTSPASFARCAGCRRAPTDAELRAGVVSLDSEGNVLHSDDYTLCLSWRRDKDDNLSKAVGTGRESRPGSPLPTLGQTHAA